VGYLKAADLRKTVDTLVGTFNAISLPLEHYHYDIFEAHVEAFDVRFKIAFGNDLKGNITSLSTQLEAMVDPLVFTRMPDKSMQDKAFLEQFVGNYELMGMLLTVTLKGEQVLIASIPGQQELELVPYQGTTFNLKGQPGFSIEFKKDESGKVIEALVT